MQKKSNLGITCPFFNEENKWMRKVPEQHRFRVCSAQTHLHDSARHWESWDFRPTETPLCELLDPSS